MLQSASVRHRCVFWVIFRTKPVFGDGANLFCVLLALNFPSCFEQSMRILSRQLYRNRRLRGSNRRRRPPIKIGFGFVSCPCRACERAAEAKLYGRVRKECLSTMGFRLVRCSPPGRLRARCFCCYLRVCCFLFI